MANFRKYVQQGQVLRELREAGHYCQSDIAAVIGVARSTYANYEAGVHIPDAEQILLLAAFYHISSKALLDKFYQTPSVETTQNRAELYAEEFKNKMTNPKQFWDEMYSPEHTRLVYYLTKVDPLGQREISEFIQKDAEGFS